MDLHCCLIFSQSARYNVHKYKNVHVFWSLHSFCSLAKAIISFICHDHVLYSERVRLTIKIALFELFEVNGFWNWCKNLSGITCNFLWAICHINQASVRHCTSKIDNINNRYGMIKFSPQFIQNYFHAFHPHYGKN